MNKENIIKKRQQIFKRIQYLDYLTDNDLNNIIINENDLQPENLKPLLNKIIKAESTTVQSASL